MSGPVKADFSNDKSGSCIWKPAAFLLTFTTGEVEGGTKIDFFAQVGVNQGDRQLKLHGHPGVGAGLAPP